MSHGLALGFQGDAGLGGEEASLMNSADCDFYANRFPNDQFRFDYTAEPLLISSNGSMFRRLEETE